MRIQGTRAALWSAAGAVVFPFLLGIGVLGGRSDPALPIAAAGDEALAAGSAGVVTDSLAGRVRRLAPFRADGHPAAVLYDPTRAELPAPLYGATRPGLILTGIVGGPAPLAVLEGVPGREGPVLLAVGDTIAGLKIRRIKEGRVTVTGLDTTWVLAVRGAP